MSGYTQVSNLVFDRLMAELDPYTFKVYLKIVRETTGWHRPQAYISLSQFQAATGIAKRNVICQAIRELENRRLITCHRAERITTSYQLVTSSTHHLVTASYQPPVTPSYPLKETEIKEWEEVKVKLATMMSKANYSTYFRDLELVARTPKMVAISAPSQAVADYISSRCLGLIRKAWGEDLEVTVSLTQEKKAVMRH